MKLHYMGKYNLDPDSIPTKPHRPNAVPFKEPEDSTALSKIANSIAVIVWIIFCIPVFVIHGFDAIPLWFLGTLLSLLTYFPHEFLHAICCKEDVYLYTNWQQGMLFVVAPEDMSKFRFVFMSLLPTIVFGVIPYIVFCFNPAWIWLGSFAATCISSGGGDFINIFNALTQMPKGALTYLYKFNSYWYIPEKENK